MDLVVYSAGSDTDVVSGDASAPTLLVKNTNIAADGTSLKIRILDGNGINTFYSNTVELYNSARELVATQLINPQASGSSNSMGWSAFSGWTPVKPTRCSYCASPTALRTIWARPRASAAIPTAR
ncbi:hypothetical protein [Candidatus Pantoea persica]|uniref:hypothetical protein n=1 Tax=Candidatus Pantoea persica TaxID=2518128 RepID=UPI00215D75BC|nr:hypothetical protein [Candidatus Pantoea persica]MBA2814168.1 Ig-like domain repeat protein [Candidatus Pantoea persica]